jgi:type IV pilus assembly protein PilA
MNKRKGFTLVELLAVIVILAVILVIAIPNVIKVIDKAKLDTYKRNEDMLVSATQKYMASNGISLNVGETTTINYSQLQNDKLIDKITDQTSKGECSNSKIYVTKTSSGYTYKPGLVCDNYISLDTFNGITNWNFNDTNGWFQSAALWTLLASNNKLIVTGKGGTRYVQPSCTTNIKANNGDIIYFRFYQKGPIISGKTISSESMINAGITQYVKGTSTNDNEKLINGVVTLSGQTPGNYIDVYMATSYPTPADATNQVSENREAIILNLTEMGLTGLSSNLSALEQLINKSK